MSADNTVYFPIEYITTPNISLSDIGIIFFGYITLHRWYFIIYWYCRQIFLSLIHYHIDFHWLLISAISSFFCRHATPCLASRLSRRLHFSLSLHFFSSFAFFFFATLFCPAVIIFRYFAYLRHYWYYYSSITHCITTITSSLIFHSFRFSSLISFQYFFEYYQILPFRHHFFSVTLD